MTHLLYYYFFMDAVQKIQPKYYNLIADTIDKAYLYTNMVEITANYDLLSINKNKNYQIYERLKKTKIHESLDHLKQETISNQYDAYHLLFLLTYISHKVFDNYLTSFTTLTENPFMHLNYLEQFIYQHKTKKTYHKFNQIIFFKESLTLTEKDEKIINNWLSKVYSFSLGFKHFKISLKKFKTIKQKYLKDSLGLKKIYLNTLGKIKKDERLKYFLTKPKNTNDLLNEKHQKWLYQGSVEKELDFLSMYEEALLEAINIMNLICDEIFYNKQIKKGLAKLF